MKPPALPDYVFGHVLVLAALVIATGWTGLVAFSNGAWLLPVILLVFTGYSAQANERVVAYRNWKKQWDSYGQGKPSIGWWKALIATICGMSIFILLIGVGKAISSEEGRGVAALLFLIALVAVAAWAVRRVVRYAGSKAVSRQESSDMVVRHCLGKASSDVGAVSRAYAQLPAYCLALIRQSER